MPEYLAPGVYVEEEERGPKSIPGVSTSTAAFVGVCRDGPPLKPTFVDNFGKFESIFGSIINPEDPLGYAVRGFFDNGGKRCFVVRIGTASGSELDFLNTVAPPKTVFTLKSKTYGLKANNIKATLTKEPSDSLTKNPVGLVWMDAGAVTVAGVENTYITLTYTTGEFRFVAGDRVVYDDGTVTEDRVVVSAKQNVVEIDKPLNLDTANVAGHTLAIKNIAVNDVRIRVDSALTFFPGSVLRFFDSVNTPPNAEHYDVVVDKTGDFLTLAQGIPDTFIQALTGGAEIDLANNPNVGITSCEFTIDLELGAAREQFPNLGLFPGHPKYFVTEFKGSSLVTLELPEAGAPSPDDVDVTGNFLPDNVSAANFAGGTDDNFGTDKVATLSTLMDEVTDALERERDINLVAFPGITDTGIQAMIIGHCEKMKYRFAILDGPKLSNGNPADPDRALELRAEIGSDSGHAAYYYPWLEARDDITGMKIQIPPSGHVAGIYARTDNKRGVHKAPANEKIRNIVGLTYSMSFAENERLNPEGVNCLRAFPGRGKLVWGARTISKNPSWRYVNVRRLFIYLEDSIERGTHWVVFEPNNEKLWARVRQTITNFLTGVWRANMLMGTTPEEAFFVRCDRTTMTQDDIDNGRLVCVIGVSPVKPAEFVIFRIAQWTAGSEASE
jgi:phage tail sheath protein FI